MPAYYNEIEPAAAEVLRAAILLGVIADGEVDTRSITDVGPDDLRGFTQCHFFAGGGLWSVAARLAGWPDDRPLWTGSCPCQGESLAGKRLGAADPRHLWPDFRRLIRACRPDVVVGEQVAAAAGTHWLDGTLSDLDADGYAAGAVSIPACAVDAPHQRDRIYWVAAPNGGAQPHADSSGRAGRPEGAERGEIGRASAERLAGDLQPDANAQRKLQSQGGVRNEWGRPVHSNGRSPRNGSFWSDFEWIVSPLDGKARRSKPGICFLVDGLPGRVDLWRIGGNAIVPQVAAEVLAALMEAV